MDRADGGAPAPRVAVVLPALYGGGAERVTLNLAHGLLDRGYRVDLVVAHMTGSLTESIPEGIDVVSLGGRRMAASLRALRGYIVRRRPSAVLSAMSHTNVITILAAGMARFGGNIVVVEHTELRPPSRRSLRQRAVMAAMRRAYRGRVRVVAVSEGVKASLVRWIGLPSDRIEVIYNPVITPEARAMADDAVDHPFLDAGLPLILGVGRLIRPKGFDALLRAFAIVSARTEARLIVLGDGEQRRDLEALAVRLGISDRVSFPGFVPNPHAYLARAHVFALASEHEGLPTVLIEALAAGAHVVSTDCSSGVREALAGGRLGRLVPLRDEAALAAAISDCLIHPRPEVDEAWLDQFTSAEATSRYLTTLGLGDDVASPHADRSPA